MWGQMNNKDGKSKDKEIYFDPETKDVVKEPKRRSIYDISEWPKIDEEHQKFLDKDDTDDDVKEDVTNVSFEFNSDFTDAYNLEF